MKRPDVHVYACPNCGCGVFARDAEAVMTRYAAARCPHCRSWLVYDAKGDLPE